MISAQVSSAIFQQRSNKNDNKSINLNIAITIKDIIILTCYFGWKIMKALFWSF